MTVKLNENIRAPQLNILFDHKIFFPGAYGGISRYICELACELSKNDNLKINVVAPLYTSKFLHQNKDLLKVDGIYLNSIEKLGLPGLLTARTFGNMINHLMTNVGIKKIKPDLIHETYFSALSSGPKSTKHILTMHDMIYEKFSKSTLRKSQKKISVNRADHIICVSRQTQRDLIELFDIPLEKTSVVYHGFSHPNKTENNSPSLSSVENIIKGRPYLLYVGNRRAEYKNFAGLIKAVAASPKILKPFRIVCFGGDRFRTQEKDLFAKLKFNEDDIVQMSSSDNILGKLYKHAWAFIYPSLYEGFGLPPLEAMSFDCPVACSQVSSIPEVVGDAAAFFNPADIEDMRSVMEKIVLNTTLREQLINKGRERIGHFSWARCAQETLKVYQKVLA